MPRYFCERKRQCDKLATTHYLVSLTKYPLLISWRGIFSFIEYNDADSVQPDVLRAVNMTCLYKTTTY